VDTIAALQRLASPTLDGVMLFVTDLGSQEAYTVFLVLAYLALDASFGRRLGVTFLLGAYANDLVKVVVAAPRPFEVDPSVLRTGAAAATAPGSSFPSGHAQAATTFWLLTARFVERGWAWLLAGALIVLVSLSRVYLGVHYPRDVLAGVALGLVVVLAAAFVTRLALSPGKAAVVALGALAPLALHLLVTTPDSHVLLSAVSAFVVGPELIVHRAKGGVVTRLLMGLVGVALVAAVMLTTSLVLSEELKRGALTSYLRYLVIALTGTVVAPLACRALRLSGGPVVAAGGARRP